MVKWAQSLRSQQRQALEEHDGPTAIGLAPGGQRHRGTGTLAPWGAVAEQSCHQALSPRLWALEALPSGSQVVPVPAGDRERQRGGDSPSLSPSWFSSGTTTALTPGDAPVGEQTGVCECPLP